MAITLKRSIDVLLYDDTAQARILARRNLGTITDATMNVAAEVYRDVPANSSVDIALDGFTRLRMVTIETAAPVNVRLGDVANDPIPVQPISAGNTGVAYVELDTLPVIRLTNPSLTTAVAVVVNAAGTK